ncbi:PilZ domain-containing protein [Marinobacter sp. BGYM27]|uniref:PilZ domain-containing protein n=1 Tax=Marinobacter sp. BGYM27 TaxID=2975597 RepID=UPI0021A51102|nr:PilZ domain-containing protein [Marinobacter sp. BGYM27]MDG5499277.1 PilZ domain-containing protein [Marinobacter sp. BGYM27]
MGTMNAPASTTFSGIKSMAGKNNLRQQQRVSTNIEVTVCNPNGNQLVCHTANLSRAGMLVECDSDHVRDILPGNSPIAPKKAVALDVKFAVPVVSVQSVNIEASCEIIHVRRVSKNRFQLGLQFTGFNGNGHDYVDQYVSRQLLRS